MTASQSGFTNTVLAMDLSMSQPGFAVLAVTEGKPILLDKSYVSTNAKHTHGQRLVTIAYEIVRLLALYDPEHIVREKAFSRFAGTTMTLNKVVGISDYIVASNLDKPIAEVPVTTVKKALTGKGKADKNEVADAVFRILQIEDTSEFYRKNKKDEDVLIDDMTDACAVGLAYLKQEGLIAI